jgi:hypothetical protein
LPDPDLMQERVRLVEVESDPVVQITPVIIAAPEI